jgi:hypothetical protein
MSDRFVCMSDELFKGYKAFEYVSVTFFVIYLFLIKHFVIINVYINVKI